MNRRRQEPVNVRISDEEYSRLENKFEVLRNEFLACKRKLDSKCEALLILSKELDQCRSERDQFKLMAEQLRERYQTIKKQAYGQPPCQSTSREYKNYSDMQAQSLTTMLYEAKEANKSLQFEHDDLKQKLQDALGDIKLLREQIARQRVGTTDEGMTTRHFPAHEREELVQKLESTREEYLQLERDLQTVLDEKEELVTERDVYKTKYERLNTELNYILKGDENRVVDIDALVMENKYLQDRMKQTEEEKSMALAAVSKYKSLLEKKKTKSSLKLGQSRGGGMIITQKQVQQVLDSKSSQIPSQQAMSDLQALAGALLDTVNDKNLALSHQRKTNKILGNRVAELEKKIKTLEVAGLWNVPSNVSASLEKLRQECDSVKTLIPRQMSDASESDKFSEIDKDSELENVTPLDSCDVSPDCSPTHLVKQPGHLELEDLDLLPTKEISSKPVHVDTIHMPDNALHLLPVQLSDDKPLHHISCRSTEADSSTHIEEEQAQDTILDTIVNAHGTTNTDTDSTALVNGDLSSPDHDCVQVYSDDKVMNSDDDDDNVSETSTELSDKFISENAEEETREFYKDTSENVQRFSGGDGDHNSVEINDDCVDTEASEKMGLLMESVAQKMCSISHKSTKPEMDGAGGDATAQVLIQAETEDVTSESPDPDCPLLGAQQESDAAADDPHDVEC